MRSTLKLSPLDNGWVRMENQRPRYVLAHLHDSQATPGNETRFMWPGNEVVNRDSDVTESFVPSTSRSVITMTTERRRR